MKKTNLLLKLYAVTLTFILAFFIVSGFKTNPSKQKIDELTVQRLNVVEPDGTLKMVISDSEKQHPGMFDGKKMDERERQPGMIFFNEEGDEVGGLVYAGNKKDGAGMVLSFDQYKNDQIMQMQYLRAGNGKQQYGMNIWDRSEKITNPKLNFIQDSLKAKGFSNSEIPKEIEKINDGKPVTSTRMFTGKNFDHQVGMFLKDEFGNDRIKIYIDKNNEPKFEILNNKGKIIRDFQKSENNIPKAK